MKKIVNLTPHTVTVLNDDNGVRRVYPPSGSVARVSSTAKAVTEIDGVTVVERTFGKITGLPKLKPGHAYIVSRMVVDALERSMNNCASNLERPDLLISDDVELLVPDDVVRDATGVILGCRQLSR